MIINLPNIDAAGHTGKWKEYLTAIYIVDSLIWNLWKTIQSDSIYQNTTALFVTNYHGRHDYKHGSFKIMVITVRDAVIFFVLLSDVASCKPDY